MGQKVWKKFEISSEKFGNRIFQMLGIYGNFGNCSIPNFPKTTKK